MLGCKELKDYSCCEVAFIAITPGLLALTEQILDTLLASCFQGPKFFN